MAVSYSAGSESHTGSSGSLNQASFSWTHTQTGIPQGVLIFVINLDNASDITTSVTYGSSTMTAVTGGAASATLHNCKAYFLGSALPSGNQTVTVNRTNNGNEMYAVAITVAAATNTEVTGVTLVQTTTTPNEQSINDGSPGTNSLRFAGISFEGGDVPVVGANSTLVHQIDTGGDTASVVRETTAGQGSRAVGWNDIQNDVMAAVYLAVREIPAATTRRIFSIN